MGRGSSVPLEKNRQRGRVRRTPESTLIDPPPPFLLPLLVNPGVLIGLIIGLLAPPPNAGLSIPPGVVTPSPVPPPIEASDGDARGRDMLRPLMGGATGPPPGAGEPESPAARAGLTPAAAATPGFERS